MATLPQAMPANPISSSDRSTIPQNPARQFHFSAPSALKKVVQIEALSCFGKTPIKKTF
jgi:hypothetical protein